MRLSRVAATVLAAGLLLPITAQAQMTIVNKTALEVFVHYFSATDVLMMVACGSVRTAPQTTVSVSREASADCKQYDRLKLRANFTEFWGGFEGNCNFDAVPWSKTLEISGSKERLECY